VNPLLTLPHLPAILFLGGALALGLGGATIPARVRNGLALAVCLAVGVSLFLMKPTLPLDVVFSDWLVGFTLLGSLIYRVDILNWTFAISLVILVAVAVICWTTSDDAQKSARLVPCLFAMGAATFSMLFSGNLLTLMFSWVLLTAAALSLLVVAMEPNRSICYLLIIWGVGTFLLLWAIWNVGWGDGGRWSVWAHSASVTLSVFLVSWIALGAYPVHLWSSRREDRSIEVRSLLHTIPLLVGLYLLARLSVLLVSLPFRDLWIALGAIALLLGAELAWSQRDRLGSLSFIGIALVGGVMLTAALFLPLSTGMILTWTLFLPFSLLALFLVPPRAGKHAPRGLDWLLGGVTGLAGASLIGMPPTAGFIAWSQLHNAVLSTENPVVMTVLFSIVVLSGVLIAAAFFHSWLVPAPEAHPRGVLIRGMAGAVLVLPALVGGLAPNLIVAHVAGPSWKEWGAQAYSSTTVGIWATIFLCISIGYVLNLWPPAISVKSSRAWRIVARIWKLEWACKVIEQAGRWLAGILDTITDVVHGEHYLLWAFLSLILFLWFYFFS
jgi:formate hydrogenlyase subunit 3/multisubunit Na+/H+ antiporter MnhD subunit